MRVLYLNPFSQEVSGPDESLRTLLSRLIPQGVEAHIVLPALGPQVPRYEALGARVHVAPLAILRRDISPATVLYPLRLAAGAIAVGRIARRNRIDLIHTNMEVVLDGGVAARALRLPHVLHYRGNTMDRPKLVFDGLVAVWSGTADRIFCISEATAALFRRRDRAQNVEVLYNPIDVATFRSATVSPNLRLELGAAPDDMLVGTVGRLHPRKDLETFLRAAAQVIARVPNARFAVVGAAEAPIEHAYQTRLQALARELGVAHRFVFAGARRDIPAVMRAFDIFALTSRHEGFGRVVAEAMAAGRPVVVSDEGAPPELVGRGRFGLCAAAGNPDAFAARILELAVNSSAASAMAAQAREAAWQFDASAIAERVLERYRSLLRA